MSAFEEASGQTPPWRVKNRLQMSYEFDSNIRENPAAGDSTIEDSSARFFFQSHAACNSPKTRLSLIFRTGLQTYFQNPIENKLINEFELTSAVKLGKAAAGVRGFGRLKLYLNDALDYVSGYGELFVQAPLFSKINGELAFQTAGLSYQNFKYFNYSENQLKLQVSRKLTERLSSTIELGFRKIHYNRTLFFSPPDTLRFGRKQEDDNYRFYWQVNYTKTFLFNFSYTFQYNESNTSGYGYRRHQIIVILGTPLFSGVWLRGYAAYQNKRYRDPLPMFPPDIDPERDESNFLIADLSKDLRPGLTALLRAAFYNNESIIRSRFYRKFLLTAGLDFRF